MDISRELGFIWGEQLVGPGTYLGVGARKMLARMLPSHTRMSLVVVFLTTHCSLFLQRCMATLTEFICLFPHKLPLKAGTTEEQEDTVCLS